MKIRVKLVNETSGELDSVVTRVNDVTDCQDEVLNVLMTKLWALTPGDRIEIEEA